MKRVEFMNKNDGEVVAISDDHAEILSQSADIIPEMYDKIMHDYPEAGKALQGIYQKSEKNTIYFKFLVVRRFIKCNFGEYDIREMDIDQDKWRFERVSCPMRGECPVEGIVCSPKLNTSLSSREVEVVSLCAEGLTAQEIADKLHLSICTVNMHMKHILKKLDRGNVKSVISWYNENKGNLTPA